MINKNAGIAPVSVSKEAIVVLKQAKDFAKLTDGNFDPTIGPLVRVWNINGTNPKVPKQSKIDEARALVNFENLILNENTNTAYIEKNMSLDALHGKTHTFFHKHRV